MIDYASKQITVSIPRSLFREGTIKVRPQVLSEDGEVAYWTPEVSIKITKAEEIKFQLLDLLDVYSETVPTLVNKLSALILRLEQAIEEEVKNG
jgi:hypothetical protein